MSAYFFFWFFVLIAKIVTKLKVIDLLAAGAVGEPAERQGCGPFNRDGGKFDLLYGEGFDFDTENHLTELFGYPNVCTLWDYSPARETAAIFFPLFEFSMMVYLTLDIINTRLSYKRKEIPEWFWKFSAIMYPVTVFLCTMFRMIFVFIAYENVQGHTAGFLCLQIGLVLIALQNVLYVIMTGQSYPNFGLGNEKSVAIFCYLYLAVLFVVSYYKIQGTIYIVKNGVGSPFYLEPSGVFGLLKGQVIDKIWMFVNALVPFVFAFVRAKSEDPLNFEITIPTPTYR
eukprot:jgi/Psemu1/254143/estExt_Genewise1Plus.C_910044